MDGILMFLQFCFSHSLDCDIHLNDESGVVNITVTEFPSRPNRNRCMGVNSPKVYSTSIFLPRMQSESVVRHLIEGVSLFFDISFPDELYSTPLTNIQMERFKEMLVDPENNLIKPFEKKK